MAVTFNAVDPRTGEPGAQYAEATPEDVLAAVAAAAEAFRSGALRDPAARSRALRGAAARLRAAREDIVAIAQAETGLGEGRLRSEVERTAGQLEAFGALVDAGDYVEAILDTPDPDAKPIPRPDIRRMLVPRGPVGVWGASNFPLAFSTGGGDTGSALAAGCPVLVKGHPAHPGTGERVARELSAAIAEAGLPPATFTHLLASGIEVGQALLDAPPLAAVGFTGSFRAGTALVARAAERATPIPVYAEMGSVNPLVVTAAALEARGEAIAEGLETSIATSGGQLCTKPGIVFVPAGEAGDRFVAEMRGRLAAREPEVMLSEGLRAALRRSVEGLGDPGEEAGPGFRFQPVAHEARASELAARPELLEEHFGPVVLLLRYADEDDLLAALERTGGQLTGTLHAQPEDAELTARIVERLVALAGRVIFDGFPTGVAVTHGMHHGGPFPATSAPEHTSVGMTAIRRWMRPVAFQNAPAAVLPPELRDENPLGIWRRVDGELTRGAL